MLTVNVRGESYTRTMTETGGLPPMEALAYDLRRPLETDRATYTSARPGQPSRSCRGWYQADRQPFAASQ